VRGNTGTIARKRNAIRAEGVSGVQTVLRAREVPDA